MPYCLSRKLLKKVYEKKKLNFKIIYNGGSETTGLLFSFWPYFVAFSFFCVTYFSILPSYNCNHIIDKSLHFCFVIVIVIVTKYCISGYHQRDPHPSTAWRDRENWRKETSKLQLTIASRIIPQFYSFYFSPYLCFFLGNITLMLFSLKQEHFELFFNSYKVYRLHCNQVVSCVPHVRVPFTPPNDCF